MRRLGGGFGGKETQTINYASAAAVAAHHEKRPVRLLVPRNQVIIVSLKFVIVVFPPEFIFIDISPLLIQDMCGTGKRHPFHGKYRVAYETDGKITAVDTKLFSNAGHSHDLSFPVLERY